MWVFVRLEKRQMTEWMKIKRERKKAKKIFGRGSGFSCYVIRIMLIVDCSIYSSIILWLVQFGSLVLVLKLKPN